MAPKRDRRPRLRRTPTVWYELWVQRTEDERERMRFPPDDGTIAAFLVWQRETDIYPVYSGAAGAGQYRAAFHVEDAPAVDAYLRGHGVVPEPEGD